MKNIKNSRASQDIHRFDVSSGSPGSACTMVGSFVGSRNLDEQSPQCKCKCTHGNSKSIGLGFIGFRVYRV